MAIFTIDLKQERLADRVISSTNTTINRFKSAIDLSLDTEKKIDRSATRELKNLIIGADKIGLIDNRIINAKNLTRKVNYIETRDFNQERVIRLLANEEENNKNRVIDFLHESDTEVIKEIQDIGNALVTGKYKGKKIQISDDRGMSDLLKLGNFFNRNRRNKKNKRLGIGSQAALAVGEGALGLGGLGLGFGLGFTDNDKEESNDNDIDVDKEKKENKKGKEKSNEKSKTSNNPDAKTKQKNRLVKFLSKLKVPDTIKSLFRKAFILDILLSAPDLYEAFEEGDNKRICMIIGRLVGAAAGSIVGASVGSVVPVIGTAIFGFLGGWAGSELGEMLGEKLYEGFSDSDVKKAEEKNSSAIVPSLLPEEEKKKLEKNNVAPQVKEKAKTNNPIPKSTSDIEYKINKDGSVEEFEQPEIPEASNLPRVNANVKEIPTISPVFKLPDIVKVNQPSFDGNKKPPVIVVKQADVVVTSQKSVFDLVRDILGNASDNIGNSLMDSINGVLKNMGINVSAFGTSVGGGGAVGSYGGYGDYGSTGGNYGGYNSYSGNGGGGGYSGNDIGGDKRYYQDLSQFHDRGSRNINPGNITAATTHDYLGQIGISRGSDGNKDAVFATKEAGVAGIVNRLYRYNRHKNNKGLGKRTIYDIMCLYAPKGHANNDTIGYINFISRRLGIDPKAEIDFDKNPNLLKPFVKAIMKMESPGAKTYSEEEIDKGIEIGVDEQVLGQEAAFEKHKQWLVAAEGGKKGQAAANLERENQRREEDAKNGGYPANNGQGVESKIQINENTTLGNAVSSVYASQNAAHEGKTKYYMVSDKRAVIYRNGKKVIGKDVSQGYVDCSGWVQHINRQMIEQINAAAGKEVFGKKAKQFFYGERTSEDMVISAAKATGNLYMSGKDSKGNVRDDLVPDKIKEGTMIGITSKAGFAQGRQYKIGHIVQVYKDPQTGEMMVTESTSADGDRGVTRTKYSDWYAQQMKKGKTLYGANVMELADPKLLEEAKQKAAEEEKKRIEEAKQKDVEEKNKEEKALNKEESNLLESISNNEKELDKLKKENGSPEKIAELEAKIQSQKELYRNLYHKEPSLQKSSDTDKQVPNSNKEVPTIKTDKIPDIKSEVKQSNPENKKSAEDVASASNLESATKVKEQAQTKTNVANDINNGNYTPIDSQNAGGVVTLPPKVINQNQGDKNKGGEGGGSPTFDTGDSHSAIINKDPLRK